jgi:hypothetical protein
MFFELDDIKRRHSLYWDVYNGTIYYYIILDISNLLTKKMIAK